MKKEMQQQAIALTREMLERYWQHDYEYALSVMADDVIWIGSNQEQVMQGKDQVRKDFEKTDRELVACHLSNQLYRVIHHTSSSISIAGKYLVTTDPDTGLALQVWQRCFANYIYAKGCFVLKGLHVSNPMGELHVESDESFPTALGKQSYRYLQENLERLRKDKVQMVTTKDRAVHFIYENEIVCVESADHDIVISLANTELVTRMSMSEFYQAHAEALVRTQRSLLVNPLHILEINKNIIRMDNGKELVIPPKSRAEAVREIERFFNKNSAIRVEI